MGFFKELIRKWIPVSENYQTAPDPFSADPTGYGDSENVPYVPPIEEGGCPWAAMHRYMKSE